MGKGEKQTKRAPQADEAPLDGEIDDEALDQVSGGAGRLAQELTHTVQQGASVGTNQSLTIGANETESVGGSKG